MELIFTVHGKVSGLGVEVRGGGFAGVVIDYSSPVSNRKIRHVWVTAIGHHELS